jgi:hypothetical protein
MDLKAPVMNGEIEFGFESSQHGEADVAEGSDEVGEHRDFDRHRSCSCWRLYAGVKGAVKKADWPPGRRNFLSAARLC